jgi:DNA-binding NarL/FixJ family response regulator
MGTLTTREREVLVLLGAGSPNRLIARSLGTSERTAKAHVSRILTKLGVASRLEAALAGIRHHDAICPDRTPHEP